MVVAKSIFLVLITTLVVSSPGSRIGAALGLADAPAFAVEPQATQEDDSAAPQDPDDAGASSAEEPVERDHENGQSSAANVIRFRLWDGSVAIGELENPILHMQTDFGRLEIPVHKIVQFRPGLQSYPQVKQKIDTLVEQLGDREFEVRERAHRELASMGIMISQLISTYSDGGSAERKKHLTELKEEIEQLIEESEEFGMDGEQEPLIDLDAVNTGDFTVLGTIEEKEFVVQTKYGSLKIGLDDVRVAERSGLNRSPTIRKVVNIKGTQFMQTSPVSTGIRVQRGDKVSIRADGSVNWANWGNITSTPEGIGNQGQWNGHQCGRLIARIGKNGPILDVGSRGEFVVKTSGTLYLGIAMQDAYAQNEGYSFVGEYRARITVQPAR